MCIHGQGDDALQDSVHTESYHHLTFAWLDVNVAGAGFRGTKQQLIHNLRHRRFAVRVDLADSSLAIPIPNIIPGKVDR